MPEMLARLPIRMNSGMIISSKFEAMTKGSLPSVASAAGQPFITPMPTAPISIITMPTGMRSASSTNSAMMPTTPMAAGVMGP